MNPPQELYDRRRKCDPRRQPRHAGLFYQLDAELPKLSPSRDHPYSLAKADYLALKEIDAYRTTCGGGTAGTTASFFYRITTWPRLVADLQESTRKYIQGPGGPDDRGETFRLIERQSGMPGAWLPLARFIQGDIVGRRGLTWWTTADLPSAVPMCAAHRMGLFNNEVGTELLVLRCSSHKMKACNPKVPSIVDAFFSHVFAAARDFDDPVSGRAISLEEPVLTLGTDEYVVGTLNIKEVEMSVWPANLNKVPVHQVHLDDRFNSLLRYYESLP